MIPAISNQTNNFITLPSETTLTILLNLDFSSLKKASCVCKDWDSLAHKAGKEIVYRDIAIRNETWRKAGAFEHLIGENDEDEFKSLPENIFKIMVPNDLLFHLPKAFNMEIIGDLFKQFFPETKHDNGYQCFITEGENDIILDKSRWILLKTSPILGSVGQDFNEQKSLIIEPNKIPNVTQIAAAMLGKYIRSETMLFLEQEIRCLDQNEAGDEQRTIKFTKDGVVVAFDLLADENIAITSIQELS